MKSQTTLQGVKVESDREEVALQPSVSCFQDRMQLTPFCLTLSCLWVTPDRSQFFRYDSVSLGCKNQINSDGWQVKRKTSEGGVGACSYGSSGSTCVIRKSYPIDSGTYWCQSADGQTSNSINITVTDRSVILESPALPVSHGAAVTLRCRPKLNSSDHMFHFYREGRSISSSSTGAMTIPYASKSDEGLYKCSIAGGEESESSWLAVEAPLSTSSSPPSAASSPPVCVSRLLCHLVAGAPYLLSTILLGLIYRDRRTAERVSARRSSNVVMEILT